MFKEGDLVFAKCTKPWPGKITKIFTQTTFKVDFYNHNSFAVVDIKDLELMDATNIQFYREKFKKKRNNEELMALEGIRLAEIEFNRRKVLLESERKKWKKDYPTGKHKQQYQRKLKIELDRPVYKPKPKQPQKKQSQKKAKHLSNKETNQQIKKTETNPNQQKTTLTIKTRSKIQKNESQSSEQLNNRLLRGSTIQKRQVKEQKNLQKSKKIKKESKKSKSKKQKKNKSKKNKQNKNTKQQDQEKVQPVQNQNLKSEINDEKVPIHAMNIMSQNQNAENCSSMVVELSSPISFSQSQKPRQMTILEQLPLNQQNKGRPTKKSEQKVISNENLSASNEKSQPNMLEKRNSEFQVNQDKHQIQKPNLLIDTNTGYQIEDFSQKGQQKIQVPLQINQPIIQNCPLQAEDHNKVHLQQQISKNSNEQNSEHKMSVMNNLDLSISSFVISESEEISLPNNPTEAVGLQQIQPQHLQQQNLQAQVELSQKENLIVPEIPQNLPSHEQRSQQNRMLQIDGQQLNKKLQSQNNLQNINEPMQEENIAEAQSLHEESLKQNENEQLQQTFQNLTPVTPNLLYNIIKQKVSDQPELDQKVDQKQASQPIIEQVRIQVQNGTKSNQALQKQRSQVNSQQIANNVSMYQPHLKDIQLGQNKPEDNDNACRYFQRIYGDFSLNNRDYIKMVRGIPDLKKELQNTDKKLIAICTNEYLDILRKFIAPQNSKKQMVNLEMWQRQLLIAVLDADILDLKVLVQYQLMFKMMSFISAFEHNKTAKRAQCHVEYLFVVSRLDIYLNRLIKQRYKGDFMHKASAYDNLIREFNQRVQN